MYKQKQNNEINIRYNVKLTDMILDIKSKLFTFCHYSNAWGLMPAMLIIFEVLVHDNTKPLLLTGHLQTNSSEILLKIRWFVLKKTALKNVSKMSAFLFCYGINMLKT